MQFGNREVRTNRRSEMSYSSQVRVFVVENFHYGDTDGLDESTSFLESGIIDSTGILELVSFLEETYSIIVEDDELIPENLDSLSNIDQFLEGKLNGERHKAQGTRLDNYGF